MDKPDKEANDGSNQRDRKGMGRRDPRRDRVGDRLEDRPELERSGSVAGLRHGYIRTGGSGAGPRDTGEGSKGRHGKRLLLRTLRRENDGGRAGCRNPLALRKRL